MKIMIEFLRKHNFRGKGRLINSLIKTEHHQNIVVPYKKGTWIEINTSELIGWNIFWMGGYEDEVMWVLDHLLKDKGIAIDIGANIGVWSVVMASKYSKVFCVEPHPEFRSKLTQNIQINQLKNVEIIPYAISQSEGEGILFSPPKSMKNKSASILNLNPELSEEIVVKIKSLDSEFSMLQSLDFIKIDCDGSDGDIILSGKKTITKHMPYILFEDLGGYESGIGDVEAKQKAHRLYEEAFDFLRALNYRTYEIKDQYLIESNRVHGRYTNMLAIPPAR